MRKNILVFTLCIIFVLCSCQSKETSEETYVENYETLLQASSDINFGDTSYNIETDSQNYFSLDTREYAAIPNGYYTIWNQIIYFIDKETCKCLPLCTNIDCSHNNIDCDAYFGETASHINYYNGNLYTVVYSTDELNSELRTYSLYKISLDGSIREKVFDIYSFATGSPSFPLVTFHRNNIYYRYENGENCYLVRCDLDGSNPCELYRVDSENGFINLINGYGDGVLFSYSLDITKSCNFKIAYYSCIADELYLIADTVNSSFTETEDSIIYTDKNNMVKININDLSTEILVENIVNLARISYDGKYIYVDNENALYTANGDYSERKIDVYDTEGQFVEAIILEEQVGISEFGDKDYMFFAFNDDKYNFTPYMLDKTQIGTGNHEWTELEGLSR